jgi:uncharacterized protein YraI
MKNYRTILILVVVLFVTACNLPISSYTPPAPNNSSPTSTLTPAFPPSPTFTTVPAATSTPSEPQLTPNTNAVNCRLGPNVVYESLDVINSGQNAVIAGKNEDSSWWYVHDPNNSSLFCWVAASVSTTAGNLSNLPVIPVTAVIVTAVTVNASVNFSMCGQPNSAEFSGSITTNGATKVTFRWEVSGAISNILPSQTISFSAAGTKNAPNPGTLAHLDCGKYTITLHVLSPNDISAKKNFKIGP